MTPRTRIVVAWLPAAAYMGLIWALSGMPQPFDLRVLPFKDKGVHALEYAVLAFLDAGAIRGTWPAMSWQRLGLTAAGVASLWGYLDEIHQAFVPSRQASLLDFAADAAGALLGVAIYFGVKRQRRPLNPV